MSMFKTKPEKVRHVSDIYTLDEMHRKIVAEFQKRKNLLPKKKQKLQRMKEQLEKIENRDGTTYTNEDIKLRAKFKTNIREYEEENYDIENNISEIEYYSNTDDLLMDYYDIIEDDDDYLYEEHPELSQEKLNSPKQKMDVLDKLNMLSKKKRKEKRVTRRRKKRQVVNTENDILTYFGCPPKEESEIKNTQNRAEISLKYRILIDKEFVPSNSSRYNPIKHCNNCGTDKTLIQSEGIYVCLSCGEVEMVIIESERPNYKDPIPDKPGYPYKRINHYNEFDPLLNKPTYPYMRIIKLIIILN